MQKKSPIEMERHRVAKVTRALLRLKYSLMADEAINETLPDTLEEFDAAIQQGELKGLEADLDEITELQDSLKKLERILKS